MWPSRRIIQSNFDLLCISFPVFPPINPRSSVTICKTTFYCYNKIFWKLWSSMTLLLNSVFSLLPFLFLLFIFMISLSFVLSFSLSNFFSISFFAFFFYSVFFSFSLFLFIDSVISLNLFRKQYLSQSVFTTLAIRCNSTRITISSLHIR